MEWSSMTGATGDPTLDLLVLLISTFCALGVGSMAVSSMLIDGERGDLKGWEIFVGRMALPLLVFRLVSTSSFGDIDLRVIAACTLGKMAVFGLTFGSGYLFYDPSQSRAQRFLSAATMGFFSIASNDFVIALPLIGALGGGRELYVAGNAIAMALILQPLNLLLFEVGKQMLRQECLDEEPALPVHAVTIEGMESEGITGSQALPKERAASANYLAIALTIVQNPIISMTLLGLFTHQVLRITNSVSEDGDLQLPTPLRQVTDLITSPYNMMSLFLTGASISSFRLSTWSTLLVLMKGVACAGLSYAFALLLIPESGDAFTGLHDITIFYGAIPASTAPLVLATQFSPDLAPLIAAAIFWGMLLAGPILLACSVLIQVELVDVGPIARILSVTSIIGASLVALALGMLCRPLGVYSYLILTFAAWVMVYSVLTLAAYNDESLCDRWMHTAFSFTQGSLVYMIWVMQLWSVKKRSKVNITLLAIWGTAALGSFFFEPYTFDLVCQQPPPSQGAHLLRVARACFDLLISLGLCLYVMTNWASYEFSTRRATGVSTDLLASRVDFTLRPGDPESDQPASIYLIFTVLQTLRLFLRAVNTIGSTRHGNKLEGGVAMLIILEIILEHGQGLILFLAFLFEDFFVQRLKEWLKRRLPGQSELDEECPEKQISIWMASQSFVAHSHVLHPRGHSFRSTRRSSLRSSPPASLRVELDVIPRDQSLHIPRDQSGTTMLSRAGPGQSSRMPIRFLEPAPSFYAGLY